MQRDFSMVDKRTSSALESKILWPVNKRPGVRLDLRKCVCCHIYLFIYLFIHLFTYFDVERKKIILSTRKYYIKHEKQNFSIKFSYDSLYLRRQRAWFNPPTLA